MAADFDKIKNLTEQDIECLKNAEVSYGDSWRKRGGIGAFMMLAPNVPQIISFDLLLTVINSSSSRTLK